jgi:membrane-bound lytic murein transglycosylase D
MVAHAMSLVHKIPSMVSALAFGYGVGMSAPESAITSVHSVVAAYQRGGERSEAPLVVTAPLPAARPVQLATAPWSESRELSRLRDLRERDARDGVACEVDPPSYSRPPRFASNRDGYADDVNDLDAAGAEALSRLQLSDLKLAVTRRTLKYVRFFTRTDQGRQMFETWLKRSGRYQELIQAELRERRLPEDLIWVAMIESGFDPRAKSPAGAVGLWQFMPATGAVYGLQQSRLLDQRKNPRLATQAAAHHLRDLYLRFGSWDLALAAYNMGYEQLLDRIDQYGTSDLNELARQEAIPSETAAYVPKIGAAAIVANNLERFGFDHVEVSRPLDAAEIAAPPGTPLRTLAKAAGVATSLLRKLNPDFLGDRVPSGRGDFLVMLPADTLARAQATLPSLLDTEPFVSEDASVLNPVDLLGGRDFTRRRALRERDDDDSLLSLLPRPASSRRRSMRDPVVMAAPDDADPGALDDAEDDLPLRRSPARNGRQMMLYRIGQGDTLIGVARQFALDVDDVVRENGMDSGQKLRAGALLKLRVKPDVAVRAADAEPHAAPEHAGDEAPARAAAQQDDTSRGPARAPARGRATTEAPESSPPPAEKKRTDRG